MGKEGNKISIRPVRGEFPLHRWQGEVNHNWGHLTSSYTYS